MAGEVAWRWRSYGLVADMRSGLLATEFVSHVGDVPAPNHRLLEYFVGSALPGRTVLAGVT